MSLEEILWKLNKRLSPKKKDEIIKVKRLTFRIVKVN